jgi:hypothetical protein
MERYRRVFLVGLALLGLLLSGWVLLGQLLGLASVSELFPFLLGLLLLGLEFDAGDSRIGGEG